MKKAVYYTSQFRKDFKLCMKRGYDTLLIKKIMTDLENGEQLPLPNKDHALTGGYTGYRKCHVQPDWLLVYQTNEEIIVFDWTGTHSDLF